MCVDMGKQQYILHSNITFIPPIKLVCSLAYLVNPMHRYNTIADQQYQNNLYDHHLVKDMNSYLKKIVVAAIDKQWINRAKNMVIGYAKKSLV